MTPRPSRAWPGRACMVAAAALVTVAAAVAQPVASAPAPSPPPASAPRLRPAAAGAEEGVRWQGLTQAQRQVLAPLEHEWPTMDASGKQKWLTIADRFHSLPPQEQSRISERMSEWSRLTPAERGEVRMRFQEARQVPAPDRSARWEAYQKLPPAERQQLLARAIASAPGASAARRASPAREATAAKANVVPNPALAQPPRPVSPAVVQASPGATTRLITRPATPPAHQQTGMPKIAATPEFVNRSTLLPKRGPQAAAVVPMGALPPASGSGPSAARLVVPAASLPPGAAAASTPPR